MVVRNEAVRVISYSRCAIVCTSSLFNFLLKHSFRLSVGPVSPSLWFWYTVFRLSSLNCIRNFVKIPEYLSKCCAKFESFQCITSVCVCEMSGFCWSWDGIAGKRWTIVVMAEISIIVVIGPPSPCKNFVVVEDFKVKRSLIYLHWICSLLGYPWKNRLIAPCWTCYRIDGTNSLDFREVIG